MWFDVQQALTEIEGGTLPPSVQLPVPDPARASAQYVAVVASVAACPAPELKNNPAECDLHPHGISTEARSRTWTGCVVSLAAWRMLTEWERHGPKDQHWNGLTRQWETPKGNING